MRGSRGGGKRVDAEKSQWTVEPAAMTAHAAVDTDIRSKPKLPAGLTVVAAIVTVLNVVPENVCAVVNVWIRSSSEEVPFTTRTFFKIPARGGFGRRNSAATPDVLYVMRLTPFVLRVCVAVDAVNDSNGSVTPRPLEPT